MSERAAPHRETTSHAAYRSRGKTWDHIDLLRKEAGLTADEIPDGAITVGDYAERYGIPHRTADEQLKKLVKQGALKTGKALVIRVGYRRWVSYFWPA
jgi:Fic family protein